MITRGITLKTQEQSSVSNKLLLNDLICRILVDQIEPSIMKAVTTITLFLVLSMVSFGQQLIPEALSTTETNSLGDATTNVVDPFGARQGDWTYQDIYGRPILKETYEDHVLKQVYYSIRNTGESSDWKVSTDWNSNPLLAEKLKKTISEEHKELKENQQIVLMFGANGELIRIAQLGIWDNADADKVDQVIHEFLTNNQITIGDDTFVLL